MAATQTRASLAQVFLEKSETVFIDLTDKRKREILEKNLQSEDKAFGNTLDLTSEQTKVFIALGDSFYHFWHDEIGLILSCHKNNKDVQIVIDDGAIAGSVTKDMVEFLFKALDYHKVNYVRINREKLDGLLINKLVPAFVDASLRFNTPEDLYNFIKPFIKKSEIEPYRKVYFSRSGLPDRDFSGEFITDEKVLSSNLHHDNRIDDHKKLESFFEDLGFEVIVPERDFKTFEDQLNYVYTIKTFASLTSSGITNVAFMQPGQVVIELVTPLLMASFRGSGWWMEEIHHFFSMLSFNKSHLHIGIPNDERSVEKVIERFDRFGVSSFLRSQD